MRRLLIAIGVALVAIGLLWPWLGQLPLGRLPGDIHVERDGFNFYLPLTTCIVISVLISLVFWLIRKITG